MKTTRHLMTLLTLGLFAVVNAFAQGPNNTGTYYQNADGKKGAQLKTALCAIITDNHQSLTYGSLWDHYKTTDKRADEKVWDMYSSTSNFVFVDDQDKGSGGSTEGDKYNREHSWPNSWFGGVKNSIMYSDLFHLYPTDKLVNNKRGNNCFGENNGESYQSNEGFSKLGACTYPGSGGIICFEPNDIYKGDFARTYFYMVTRYENELPTWYSNYGTLVGASETIDGTTYPGLKAWQLNMLMEWAAKDPVDQPEVKETPRNQAVYDIQKNRNPFIDYPGLERYIWGDFKTVSFSYNNYQVPTEIMTVTAAPRYDGKVMYNLAGQKVDKGYKGLVIIGGKRCVNK